VKKSSLPLSSEALLSIGSDPAEQNKRVQAATLDLFDRVIPSTCRELDRKEKALPRVGSLSTSLKLRGINMRFAISDFIDLYCSSHIIVLRHLDKCYAQLTLLQTEALLEMVARTIKNEARRKLRQSNPSHSKEIMTEFVTQALGPNRREFWEREGLTILCSRYKLGTGRDQLLTEVITLDTSRIILRLKFWFGERKESIELQSDETENIDFIVHKILQPVVRPFTYVNIQEGNNWFGLLETPEEFRRRFLTPYELDIKKNAVNYLENAIGFLLYYIHMRISHFSLHILRT